MSSFEESLKTDERKAAFNSKSLFFKIVDYIASYART